MLLSCVNSINTDFLFFFKSKLTQNKGGNGLVRASLPLKADIFQTWLPCLRSVSNIALFYFWPHSFRRLNTRIVLLIWGWAWTTSSCDPSSAIFSTFGGRKHPWAACGPIHSDNAIVSTWQWSTLISGQSFSACCASTRPAMHWAASKGIY